MTKESFEVLQSELQQSGMSIRAFLHERGLSYSTYNYWRKKCRADVRPQSLAPIRLTRPMPEPRMQEMTVSGVSLLFPNGVRAHFGQGAERVLMEVLQKSMSSDVLP